MYVKPGQICIEMGEIQFLGSVMRGITKKLVFLTSRMFLLLLSIEKELYGPLKLRMLNVTLLLFF